MSHDPLCPWMCDCGEIHNEMQCEQCDLIADVRRDMLAKCIAAVEAQWPDPCVSMCGGCRVCWACMEWARALAALRALEEKP